MDANEAVPGNLVWCKSQSSVGDGACIEVALWDDMDMIVLRDSDDRARTVKCTLAAWRAFRRGMQGGDFDGIG